MNERIGQHTGKEPLRLSRSLAKKLGHVEAGLTGPALRFLGHGSEMSLALIEPAPMAASGRLRLPTPQPASQKLTSLSSPPLIEPALHPRFLVTDANVALHLVHVIAPAEMRFQRSKPVVSNSPSPSSRPVSAPAVDREPWRKGCVGGVLRSFSFQSRRPTSCRFLPAQSLVLVVPMPAGRLFKAVPISVVQRRMDRERNVAPWWRPRSLHPHHRSSGPDGSSLPTAEA